MQATTQSNGDPRDQGKKPPFDERVQDVTGADSGIGRAVALAYAQSFEGDKLREFGKQSPMKRPAQPAELAPSYVFLASDEARFISGEILGVTGGKPY